MLKKISTKNTCEKGFSIMELLLSLTLFLMAVGAIYSVARIASIQKNTINTRTDQLRSARIALEYIRRDVVNAGFGYHRVGLIIPDNAGNFLFKIKSDTDTDRDLLTSVISGNEITNNSINFGGKTDVIGIISRDQTFNGGVLIEYTKAEANGTAVDVIPKNSGDIAKTKLYDLYMLESVSGTTQVVAIATSIDTENKKIQFAPGNPDPLKINQSATGTGNNKSLLVTTPGGGSIKRLNLFSYSVTEDGVLVRKRFGNEDLKTKDEQIEIRELVYGVSDFQIKYFMEDGTTVDDPSNENNGRLNQLKLNNIVQIQISITLAGDSNDGNPQVKSPITIKEFISTKNLRYESS